VGRPLGYNSADHPKRPARRKPGLLWDISVALGWIAIGLLVTVFTIFGVQHFPAVKETFAPFVPEPVRHFFEKNDTPMGVGTSAKPSPGESRSQTGSERKGSGQHAWRFGVGSTKDEVLSIQGRPTRRTQDTWSYDESEVYFTLDRVVGWRNSASHPLRIR
jgi:hypothetical protein